MNLLCCRNQNVTRRSAVTSPGILVTAPRSFIFRFASRRISFPDENWKKYGTHAKKSFFYMLTILALLISSGVAAEETSGKSASISSVENYYRDLRDWQSHFVQEIFNPLTKSLRRSEGEIFYIKPGKFLLRTGSPSVAKLVGSGDRFWIYQPDENQLFKGTLDRQQPQTKLLLTLLTGEGKVADQFRIEPIQGKATRRKLIPRHALPQIVSAEIEFDSKQGHLKELVITDALSQRVTLRFEGVKTNQNLEGHHRKKPIDPLLDRNFLPIIPKGVLVLQQ